MSTTMKPEQQIPKEPGLNAAIPGSRELLLRGPKPRYVDVVVPTIDGPAKFRLQELKQGELEEIANASIRQELVEGKVVAHFEQRGNKARYVASSLVDEQGAKYFPKPMEEYVLLNATLSSAQMDVLYKAVQDLNGLSEESRKELGKPSGGTGDSRT